MLGAATAQVIAARMVNAIPIASLAVFGFGATVPPHGSGTKVPVPVLVPICWTFRGGTRERCVSYFTLRTIIVLMETMKDFYSSTTIPPHLPLPSPPAEKAILS